MIDNLRAFATMVIALNGKRKSEEGATAVEYGLLVAAIAAIIVALVFGIGRLVQGGFQDTCTAMNTGTGGGEACTP